MCKLSAVVLDRDRRTVLAGLGRMGVMHLLQAPAAQNNNLLAPIDYSEEIERCEQLMQRLGALRRALQPQPEKDPAKKTPSAADLSVSEIDALLERDETTLASLSDRQKKAEAQLNHLDAVLEQLRSFSSVNV